MSTTATIYAFLDDTALHRRVRGMKAHASANQGVCCIDDQMVNYFVDPSTIVDARPARLKPIGIASIEGGTSVTDEQGALDGVMSLHFDGGKIGDLDLSETRLTATELNYLFNIIEYAAYSQNEQGVLLSAATMNATINAQPGTYGDDSFYLLGSLRVSAESLDTDYDVRERVVLSADNYSSYQGKVFIKAGQKTGVELTALNREEYIGKVGYVVNTDRIEAYAHGVADPINPVIRTWIEFTVTLSGGQLVTFHIFMGRDAFMADYPYSTITDIVYPCDPNLLLDLSTVTNVADMLSQSSSFINSELMSIGSVGNRTAGPIEAEDHSGLLRYPCIYNNATIGNGQGQYELYFGVMYKGVEPDSEEARIAIKNDLLERTSTTDADWQDILPDLFAAATFILFPLWHHTTINAGREIPSKVYGVTMFPEIVKRFYPNYTEAQLKDYLEVLPNAVSPYLILAMPSMENREVYRRLRTIHPTYQAVANSSTDVDKQSTSTIKFAEKLNDTMGQLIDSQNSGQQPAGAKAYNGVYCVSFVEDGISYYVVTPQTFVETISVEDKEDLM